VKAPTKAGWVSLKLRDFELKIQNFDFLPLTGFSGPSEILKKWLQDKN
jgi:hypothetical protein